MANPIRWLFDQARRIFRKATGGAGLGDSTILGLRDEYATKKAGWIADLSSRLLNGEITKNQWLLDFRQELKNIYINQYALGRGGYNAMTQADWGSLGGQLKRQYEYMQRFSDDIAAGRLSQAQIEQRMRLYFNSATQAYERGKARSAGLVLPQYPGDGRTQCRTNCKCEWDIQETDEAWDCYWRLNPAEHCPDCIRNSQTWNPLRITK